VVPVLVTVDVPAGIVPLVPVEPLPEALPVALLSVWTGGPPPVSVAVVPDVELGVLWIVSVDPCVDSAGCRLQARHSSRSVTIANVLRMADWSAM